MKEKLTLRGNWLYLGGIALLLLLAMWHRGDTKAGAIASGDLWLVSQYSLLAVSVIICVTVVGGLLYYMNHWGLERIFLVAGLCFGFLYLLVLPPLSAPDEVSHYITAYRLSNQMMGKTAVQEQGLVYIRQEDAWIEDIYGKLKSSQGDSADFSVLGQTLTEETYRMIYENGLVGASGDNTVVSHQWPVKTTPLAYVPQAVGITLARLMGMGSIGLLMMGRLFNLLFYVVMTFLAMRRLPFGKEILFGVALLPMTLHITGSMSYDVMILAMSFYFTSMCLDLAYRKQGVRKRDVAALALVMGVLGPCKMVYAPIMALCLLIPVRKFGGWRNYIVSAAVVLGTFVIALTLANMQTIATYATETESFVEWAGEAGYSFSQLLSSPGLLFKMFYNTFIWQAEHYHMTMIGAYLGNLDVVLDVPYVVVVFFSVALIGLSMEKPEGGVMITGYQRLCTISVFLLCAAVILFSMLLAYTPVSSPVIAGVQGRYFLPLLPILLMSLKNKLVILGRNADRSILYLMCCANGYVLVRLFGIVSMRL